MNIDIKYYNDKGPSNRYQEWYIGDGNDYLILRANFKNDKPIGYSEYQHVKETTYYIR